MKRREFVKAAAASAAALPFSDSIAAPANAAQGGEQLDFVALYGGEPAEMFRRGIAEMGGMKRFVKKGQTVVLKPNIGWDKPPEMGSNTNPELMRAVTQACFEAGAKKVLCFDHTCGTDWEYRYKVSGIREAVESAGGKMLPSGSDSMYVDCELPKSAILKRAKVFRHAVNPDVFINIPVLKHHSGAKITAAMKNFMGCVLDRRWWHSHNMPQCIADYAAWQKVDLNIIDAYRVMLEYGPIGRSPRYAPVAKYQIISTDIVAADAAATRIFASLSKRFKMGQPYEVSDIDYIALAEAHGIGTSDLGKLRTKNISLA